jgi:hypothetical protein
MSERGWANLFVAGNWLLGVGLGGLVLLALHYVTGARWSTPLRRVLEAMSFALPVAAVPLLAVLFCYPSLWPAFSTGEASAISTTESPLHRGWMDRPFFLVRSLVYLGVWMAFAIAMVRNSRRQDNEDDPNLIPARRALAMNRRLSALLLVVFGVTCWLSSSDWLMSLDRDWASTIFGVYNFAGIFVSALAAECIVTILLRQGRSVRAMVNENQLHDLGTLLFGFSSFWMYTWFCQYMLIWYVNIPEETTYFRLRWHGDWREWVFLDLALNWVVPFVVLLFRSAKRNRWILGTVALVVLVGRWVDLAVMILPTQGGASPTPTVAEAGWLVGAAVVLGVVVFVSLRTAPGAARDLGSQPP